MIALLLALQSGWTATPPQPTVGDTIYLERRIATPTGWRVRAGKIEATGNPVAEPLADAVPELRRFAAQTLAHYAVPARWAVVDTFPLTPHGKVDLRELDRLAEARA